MGIRINNYNIVVSVLVLLLISMLAQAQHPVDFPYRHNLVQEPLQKTSNTSQETSGEEAQPNADETIQDGLKPYGYDFFHTVPSLDELKAGGLMPQDYRLGPGDRLGLYLVGKAQEQIDVLVNVEGKVYVPPAGVFSVQGLTIEQFRQVLDKQLAPFYSNYNVEVMLISPKSVRVGVIGDVRAPGKYTLSSLNTVLDAIIRAEGPTIHGSLRDIQLHRSDTLFARFDMYDFLLFPKNSRDIYLQSGDKVYVPLAKFWVTVEGEVYRQAIFELSPTRTERLSEVIEMAGGFTEYAYLDKVEISRIESSGQRSVQYVDYNEIVASPSSPANIELRNGDKVQVYSSLEKLHDRVVWIHGEVRNPDKYELEDNMHLSDLILKAGNLTRSAYTLEAEVAKIDPKLPARFVKVDLQRLLNDHDSSQDILLEEDDRVFIRRIPEWEVGPVVEIRGEVMFPGYYSIVKDSTTLSEILLKSGGFTQDAMIREASLIRRSSKIAIDKEFERLKSMTREEMSNLEYEYFVMKQNSEDVGQIVVDFYRLIILGDTSEDVILDNGDVIYVPKAPRVVGVTGRVGKPGGVIFSPDKKLSYYINRAGGYSWDADKRRTKVIKVTGEIVDDEDVDEFVSGDQIWVPRKADRDYWEIFRQTMLVAAQVATVYLVVETALSK